MPPRSDYSKSYRSRQSVGLGVTLIIFGLSSIALNAVGIVVSDDLAIAGHGFWCGGMFIVTGSFGIGAKHKHRCMITAFMIMCIFSAIITICLLGLGIGGAISSNRKSSFYCRYYGRQCAPTGTVMEALLAVLAVATAIVSIWGSANCCRAICCCAKVYMPYVASTNGNQYTTNVTLTEQQQQQLELHYPATPAGTSPARPVFDPPPNYLPPTPQQLMVNTSSSRQPFLSALSGSRQLLEPSAPEYETVGSYFTPPPSYEEATERNNEQPIGDTTRN